MEVEDSTMVFLMVTLNTITSICTILIMVSVLHVGLLVNMFGHLLQRRKLQLWLEASSIAHALLVAFSKFLHSWETIITVKVGLVIHSGMAKAV